MGVRDGERLAHASGTGAEQSVVADAAAAPHGGKAGRWHQGADQHRAGAALGFANEVDAPMDAVGTVDICVARRPEHHGITHGWPAVTVRRRVGMVVCLDFYNRSPDTVDKKRCTNQIWGHFVDAAGEEASR